MIRLVNLITIENTDKRNSAMMWWPVVLVAKLRRPCCGLVKYGADRLLIYRQPVCPVLIFISVSQDGILT